MGPHDDRDAGPGYWEPEGREEALDAAEEEGFAAGAKSRDAEIAGLCDELADAEETIEILRALLLSHGIALPEALVRAAAE